MVVKQEVEAAAIYPEKKFIPTACNATAPSALASDLIGAVNWQYATNLLLPTGHEQKERENNLLFATKYIKKL